MSSAVQPRIPPLEPPYAPELAAMLDKWMPPGSGLEPPALFRTLGRHEELASRARPLGAGILANGLVPPRVREVLIHRTCALTGAEYEWGVHVMGFGRPLGFSEEHLAATVHGTADDPVWAPAERAAFRLADELHACDQHRLRCDLGGADGALLRRRGDRALPGRGVVPRDLLRHQRRPPAARGVGGNISRRRQSGP